MAMNGFPSNVMQQVLMTQYFDTLKALRPTITAMRYWCRTRRIRSQNLFGQIRNAIMVGTELASHGSVPPRNPTT